MIANMTRTGRWAGTLGWTLAAALALGGSAVLANQGFEPMRQVARELGHPALMIVFDYSGSTAMTPVFDEGYDAYHWDRGGNARSFWGFEYSLTPEPNGSRDTTHHLASVTADFKIVDTGTHDGPWNRWPNYVGCSACEYYPDRGAGAGYWMYVGLLPEVTPSGADLRAWFDTGQRSRIRVLNNPGWGTGDIVQVSGWPRICSNNGLYRLRENPTPVASGSPYWHFRVEKIRDSGDFSGAVAMFFHGPSWLDDDSPIRVQRVSLSAQKDSVWYFVPPSRMTVQKNVLGGHLRAFEALGGLGDNEHLDACGKPYYRFGVHGGPRGGAFYNWTTKAWVNWPDTNVDPVPDPTYTVIHEPADFVLNGSQMVNWGLVTYSGDGINLEQAVVADEGNQGPSVATIRTKFRAFADGGIRARGGTPTRAALVEGLDSLVVTATGDEQRTCRTWGVLLVTDGESNTGNPGGNEWGDACPADWQLYPPGIAENIWNATTAGLRLNMRTFVVGVSPEVSRCELNYTAYRGRADAGSPLGDGGFDWRANPRLPPNDYDPATGDYAYFADDVAEFREALIGVLGSLGSGDYNTAPPAVTGAMAGTGSLGFVTSAGFPGWRGHLYAYDLRANCEEDTGYGIYWDCTKPCGWRGQVGTRDARSDCVWDGGEVLAEGNRDEERAIYTWAPPATAGNPPQLLKIENTASVRQTLRDLGRRAAGCWGTASEKTLACAFNALIDSGDGDANGDGDVLEDAELQRWVDYILGNTGSGAGVRRPWPLGSLVYTTPAVTGPPLMWKQERHPAHAQFEYDYQSRHRMVWVGSSGGMVHAFDVLDGAEVMALLPPGMLDQQARQYRTFLQDPHQRPTGQPRDPMSHDYGVANSMRFADIWVPAEDDYRTVLYITEGKGGKGVHAVDITHPYPGRTIQEGPDPVEPDDPDPNITYPPDPNYDEDAPVRILWSRWGHARFGTINHLVGLGETWSIPALGGYFGRSGNVDIETWGLQLGSGFTGATATNATFWLLDPATGAVRQTHTIPERRRDSLVNVQAFADSVFWSTTEVGFQPDNWVDQMVQADLHGRLYFSEGPQNQLFTSAAGVFDTGGDPIYFSPAVGLKRTGSGAGVNFYAFASGCFFEKSPNVTGVDASGNPNFTAELFIAARAMSGGEDHDNPRYRDPAFRRIAVENVLRIDPDGEPIPGSNLSNRSQVTSAPMILIPGPASPEKTQALFLLYDPDGEECGASYIVRIEFTGNVDRDRLRDFEVLSSGAYFIGAGIMGGFALVDMGDHYAVVASRSYRGSGGRAGLVTVPDLRIEKGVSETPINWWRELM